MPTIPLPIDSGDKVKLADWMEINALIDAKDHSSSTEDLVSELKIINSEDKTEELKNDTSGELLQRMKKLGDIYPFTYNGILLKVKRQKNFNRRWAYIFCLLLSYIGVKGGIKIRAWNQDITKLFEEVSGIAAKEFISGQITESKLLEFGHPRRSWAPETKAFSKALEILRSSIASGQVKKNPRARWQKDAGLDIVTWRDFPDNRSTKTILFGQCAAGDDYRQKMHEITLFEGFFEMPKTHMKGLFIPHEVDDILWEDMTSYPYIGILFDRSRISLFGQSWTGGVVKDNFENILELLKNYGQPL